MDFCMEDKRQDQEERREKRRKRRIRNQILAYAVLILLIAAAAGIAVAGVKQITKAARQRQQSQEENQSMLEGMLDEEEEIQVPTAEPQPPVEMTREERLDEYVDAGIAVMPLEDKVAGLFVVTPEAITGVGTAVQAGDGTRQALEQYAVGGLIYFKKNIESEEQLREMLQNTASYARYPLFFAVDEEGGSVARLAEAGVGPAVDTARAIGETADPQNAYQAGVTIGAALSGLGFNLDLAPVADLASVEGSVMEERAYGADAQTASPFVASMVQGLKEQNVAACLKHFPGNGATTQDAHTGQAVSTRTAEEFKSQELAVFQAGIDAGADMVMVSHMIATGLTGEDDRTPCSLSKKIVTELLRGEMGYNGVVITDSLDMAAITDYYSADEAAVEALLAGCDMLLMPEDFEAAYNGVLQAVKDGRIDEKRIDDCLRRIYRIKWADRVD